MLTYSDDDTWVHLSQVADKLVEFADSGQDCIASLCTLSETGEWIEAPDGTMEYRCDVDGEAEQELTDNLEIPIAAYRVGGDAIPTKVARKLGLGEYVVCDNGGYILQGISDRPIFVIGQDGEVEEEPTTLEDIFAPGADVWGRYYTPVKWRHIQKVVGSDGSQSARYQILADILRRLVDVAIDESTFIPYGPQFSDSDFIDSF